MTPTPAVVARYYAVAEAGDVDAVLACFTADAHVHDEDRDYRGRAEIRSWREDVANRFTYTTEITKVEQLGEGVHLVHTHLEGDFPGGVVDLTQRFTVSGGLICDLEI
jgi:ketosteroid isomerase-like protein